MKSVWTKLVLVVLILGTIAIGAWNMKLSWDNYQEKNEIVDIYESTKDDAAKEAISSWQDYLKVRCISAGFAVLFGGIVLAMVLGAGPAPEARTRISKEDAEDIANAIDEQYRLDGRYLEPEEVDDDIDFDEDAPKKLPAPVLLDISFGNKCVTLTWEEVPGAEGYTILRRRDKEPWSRIGKSDAETCLYQDYSLESNRTYQYTVKAFYFAEEQKINSKMNQIGLEIYVSKGNVLPAPNMRVEVGEGGRNVLRWDPLEKAVSYRIYRRRAEEDRWKKCGHIKKEMALEFYETEELEDDYYYAVATANRVKKQIAIGEHDQIGVML